jgi:hypothetical protein
MILNLFPGGFRFFVGTTIKFSIFMLFVGTAVLYSMSTPGDESNGAADFIVIVCYIYWYRRSLELRRLRAISSGNRSSRSGQD